MEKYLKSVIFIILAIMLVYNVILNRIYLYSKSNLIPMIIITIIGLIVFAIFFIISKRMFEFKKQYYVFFIITLILMYYIYPSNITNRYLKPVSKAKYESTNKNEDYITSYDENDLSVKEAMKKKEIVFTDENFYKFIEVLYANPMQFKGFKVTIKGKIDGQVEDKENEFNIMRPLKDSSEGSMLGFLCRYKKARNCEVGSWCIVHGFIGTFEDQGKIRPLIKVSEVYTTVKPQKEGISAE